MKKFSWFFGRIALACISLPPLSRLWGKLMRLRRPRFLARRMINNFKNHYRITMEEYAGSPLDYPSLAEFFVRPLDPQKRKLLADDQFILSPADGMTERTRMDHLGLRHPGQGQDLPAQPFAGR